MIDIMGTDPLENLEKMLTDPECIALGQSFISDVKYAIVLVKEHRRKEAEIIEALMPFKFYKD